MKSFLLAWITVIYSLGLIQATPATAEPIRQLADAPDTITSGGVISNPAVPLQRYRVYGTRSGQVTLWDEVAGKIIRTFQMNKNLVVRETFLLDHDKTMVASQQNNTMFWDVITNQEIGRIDRLVYGFSNDEKYFFAGGEGGLFLYHYPSLKRLCKLTSKLGVEAFLFSPDGLFLVVRFATGYPIPEETFPRGYETKISVFSESLFNLRRCQEVKEFSSFSPGGFERFSSDSRYLYFSGRSIPQKIGEEVVRGKWRIDLVTYRVKRD